jgi:RHS repeat-associated protein
MRAARAHALPALLALATLAAVAAPPCARADSCAAGTAAAVHPDRVYPIPDNVRGPSAGGVNLASGDVNLTVPLATLQGRTLAYTLAGLYNSRSAWMAGLVANALGGCGWKLLDYPKVVQDGASYYLLDGFAAYLLQPGAGGLYAAGGPFHTWRISAQGTGTPTSWLLTSDRATLHTLGNVAAEGGYTVWNLSQMQDLNWGDTLQFVYSAGQLGSITNQLGDRLTLAYGSGGRLATVALSRQATGGGGTFLAQQQSLAYNTDSGSFGGLALLVAAQSAFPLPNGILASPAAATTFAYYAPAEAVPLALETMTDPAGAATQYRYYAGPRTPSHPAIRFGVSDGYSNNVGPDSRLHVFSGLWYNFANVTRDPDGVYDRYNEVKVYPGGLYKEGEPVPTDPYGHTAYYLFNGDAAAALLDLPAFYSSQGIDVTSPGLLGLVYFEESFALDDETVAVGSTTSYWTVAANGPQPGGAFGQLLSSTQTADQVSRTVTFTYDPSTLLPIAQSWQQLNPQVGGADPDATVAMQVAVTYAYQVYPALGPGGLNLLAEPAQITTTAQPPGAPAAAVTASQAVQWKAWGSSQTSQWAPVEELVLRQAIPESALGSGLRPNPPPATWVPAETTQSRTGSGFVEVSVDVAGLTTSVLYDAGFGLYQVATFGNADVTAGEAGYHGFEAYEPAGSWTPSGGGTVTTGAHTGLQSYGGSAPFTVTAAGFTAVAGEPYVVAAFVQPDAGGSCTAGFLAGSEWSGQQTATAGDGGWQYLQTTVAAPLPAGAPAVACTAGAVDDLRFGPVDGSFTAVVYDMASRLSSATLGANGDTTFQVRDAFARQIATVGSSGRVRAVRTSYSSRLGGQQLAGIDQFDPLQPNAELTLDPAASGLWEGFQFAANPYFPPANLSAEMTIANGALQVGTVAPGALATATFSQPATAAAFAVRADVGVAAAGAGALQESGISLQLTSGSGAQEVRATLQQCSAAGGGLCSGWTSPARYVVYAPAAGTVYASLPVVQPPQQVALLLGASSGGALSLYADGRLVLSATLGGALGGTLALVSSKSGGFFDNFVFATDPQLGLLTYDAQMRERQRMSLTTAAELAIAQTMYGGALNLPLAETRLTTLAGAGGGVAYQSGFAEFDARSLTITGGAIQQSGAYDYATPFSRSALPTQSPRLQPQSVGTGGVNTAGQQGAVDMTYAPNGEGPFDFDPSQLVVTTALDPDGTASSGFASPAGVPFAVLIAGENASVQQQSVYDAMMRQTGDYQPNFFTGDFDSGSFVTTLGYDFLGNPTYLRDPDAGATQGGFGSAGWRRLELTADGAASATPYYRYWQYDDLGRLAEEGLYPVASIDQTLTAPATGVVAAAGTIAVQPGITLGSGSLVLASGGGITIQPGFTVNQGVGFAAGISPEALNLVFGDEMDDPDWPSTGTTVTRQYRYDMNAQGSSQGYQGRLASATALEPGGPVVQSYAYTLAGAVASVTTAVTAGAATTTTAFTYAYDPQGRVAQVSASGPGQPAYAVTYGYDSLGRVVAIGAPGAPAQYASYIYANGTVTETLGGGLFSRTYTTDESGEPDLLADPFFSEALYYETRSDGSPGYLDGSISSAVVQFLWPGAPAGYTYQYDYDDFGQLQTADNSASVNGDVGVVQPLAYDANGNLTAVSVGQATQSYTYTPGTNQVASDGAGQSFTYGAGGNVTATSQPTSITYDPFTQLTRQITAPTGTVSFTYNAQGQRVLKTAPQQTLQYHYGLGSAPLQETLVPASGTPTWTGYVYGPLGLLAILQDGEPYYVLKDNLGSTRVVVDQQQEVQAYFSYLPFGALRTDISDAGSTVPVRYLFDGAEYDAETGLYNLRARLYDPVLGRFYGPDPARQMTTPYAFAENDPVSIVDPTGEWGVWSVLGVLAGGALVAAGGALTMTGAGAPAGLAVAALGVSIAFGSTYAGTSSSGATVSTSGAAGATRVGATGTTYRTKAMDADYVGEDQPGNSVWGSQVDYLSSARRQALELFVEGGALVDVNGVPFDTSTASSVFGGGGGRAIFVMDPHGHIYASKTQVVGRFHHSSFLAGQPVAAAGELQVDHGKLKLVSNRSGHYKPPGSLTNQLFAELQARGLNVAGVNKDYI